MTRPHEPSYLRPEERLLTAGPRPSEAAAVIILLHGRGAGAGDILGVHDALGVPDVAALAPEAPGRSWYPHSFLAPVARNQPWLDEALARVNDLVEGLLARGIPATSLVLFGFSQGACLACEFLLRHPRRVGGLVACTGAMIRTDDGAAATASALAGVPVRLGAGDPDPHVPFARVAATATAFEHLGAIVELRRHPGFPHTIHPDELAATRTLLRDIAARRR